MACRGIDAESCPNDGTKMHNVNFTKNDVRNVRILRFLTFLNANFYTIGKIGRRKFKFVCPKLPPRWYFTFDFCGILLLVFVVHKGRKGNKSKWS
jgi:hypothetical protein